MRIPRSRRLRDARRGIAALRPEAAEEQRENVARAVAACPVGAILVEYDAADEAVLTPEVRGER
ncbi:ferredoxin [Streptomyces sp. MS1.HAVA.3]|uniref:Ferredoxin n=1 Tax=Streptomyces caledonius TaxID=3134107 RepID=A0ABU8U528_9ACTN